jgi:hypothetical protein
MSLEQVRVGPGQWARLTTDHLVVLTVAKLIQDSCDRTMKKFNL